MAGGLTVSVRQVASYPAAAPLTPGDLLLLQIGGMGGPYATVTAATLVSSALVGTSTPLQAPILDTSEINLPAGAPLAWGSAVLTYGLPQGLSFTVGPSTTPALTLSPAGDLRLPLGSLTVARDPGGALDVVTLGFMGANTVASFNNRKGVVTLQAADIYGALGICPPDCIATTSSVDAAICAAINNLLQTYPAVWSWMGRVGDVFLTVADMNYAAANNPSFAAPLTIPTPPATVTDGEVVTAAWVTQYLNSTAGFATETWVQNYVAQNSVTSFNGRLGPVTLSLADIQGAGGAPITSPAFSGVPTAPTAALGSSTSQIATTAFVMNAVSEATAGVASFNGRTGAVVLNTTDITNAGGAPLASPALTGSPTAPTPAAGNSSTLLATTAFVTNAITAAGGVTSFNGRTGAVTLTLGDVTGVGGAPLASPALTGTPTGPTAAAGTNNTELATTAFVNAAISAIGIGVTSFEGRTGAVTLQANDISAAGGLINPSVALTGVPTAPTASAGTSSTQIATTAFVGAAILAGAVTTFNGRNGAVTLSAADISGAGGALLASPTFTGTPSAPTAAPGTSTTQLATTAFVTSALSTQAANSVTSFNGRQGVVTLTTADITGAGGAPIASPNFSGTPTVPTATAGTSTTQAASTAFVMNAIAASTAGVTSFNSRTGAVTLQTNDVSAVGGALLASPVFTGTPSAPTPTAGDNSTNIATTAFVAHALSTAAVQSFNTRTGAVTLTLGDVTGVGGAPLASPAFTGTPTAPTATAGTSTTQIATTAFVTGALGGYLPLSGGTLTGALNGTNITASGTIQGATVNSTGGGTFNGTLTAGNLSTSGNINATGQITSGGTASFPNLTATGNLNVSGTASIGGGGVDINNLGVKYAALGGANTVGLVWNTGSGFNAYADSTFIGVLVSQASDATLKENFAPLTVDPLAVLAQITLQQYDWVPQAVGSQTVTRPHASCGFTAQQLQTLVPEAVTEGGPTLGVDLMPLVAYLIGGVQKLVAMIEQLQSAVGALQQGAGQAVTAWEAI